MIWGIDRLLGRSTLSHCRRFYPEEGRTPFPSPKHRDCSTTSFHVAQCELGDFTLQRLWTSTVLARLSRPTLAAASWIDHISLIWSDKDGSFHLLTSYSEHLPSLITGTSYQANCSLWHSTKYQVTIPQNCLRLPETRKKHRKLTSKRTHSKVLWRGILGVLLRQKRHILEGEELPSSVCVRFLQQLELQPMWSVRNKKSVE